MSTLKNDPIKVLYEDDFFIIFDKPAGLLVVPTPQQEKKTLTHIVNVQQASLKEGQRLYPCHRLDRETSGVIIFAKGRSHQQLMMDVFKNRKITKIYMAFVQGRLKKRSGEIRSVIRSLEERQYHKRTMDRVSITRYQVVDQKKDFSIVKIDLLTGHPNQIRIHFKELGHPLVGERKYAFGKDYALKFRRVALHALSVSFRHPVLKKNMNVESALSKDMEVFLERHRY